MQRVEDDGPIAVTKDANDPGVIEQYAIKQKDDHDIDAPGAWTERTGARRWRSSTPECRSTIPI